MKHKKLLLNSKVTTLTQKNMPPYISRHFVLLQSLSMDSTAFFYAQFFLYLLMFLVVKKIFSLNLVAGPCDSLNFDKILWHSIDICFILFFSVFFLQAKWGNSSSASIISRRTASIGESWFPYQRWKGYLGMLPIPCRSFREILLVMFYMKSESWMLYFFRSSSTLYLYIC